MPQQTSSFADDLRRAREAAGQAPPPPPPPTTPPARPRTLSDLKASGFQRAPITMSDPAAPGGKWTFPADATEPAIMDFLARQNSPLAGDRRQLPTSATSRVMKSLAAIPAGLYDMATMPLHPQSTITNALTSGMDQYDKMKESYNAPVGGHLGPVPMKPFEVAGHALGMVPGISGIVRGAEKYGEGDIAGGLTDTITQAGAPVIARGAGVAFDAMRPGLRNLADRTWTSAANPWDNMDPLAPRAVLDNELGRLNPRNTAALQDLKRMVPKNSNVQLMNRRGSSFTRDVLKDATEAHKQGSIQAGRYEKPFENLAPVGGAVAGAILGHSPEAAAIGGAVGASRYLMGPKFRAGAAQSMSNLSYASPEMVRAAIVSALLAPRRSPGLAPMASHAQPPKK